MCRKLWAYCARFTPFPKKLNFRIWRRLINSDVLCSDATQAMIWINFEKEAVLKQINEAGRALSHLTSALAICHFFMFLLFQRWFAFEGEIYWLARSHLHPYSGYPWRKHHFDENIIALNKEVSFSLSLMRNRKKGGNGEVDNWTKRRPFEKGPCHLLLVPIPAFDFVTA